MTMPSPRQANSRVSTAFQCLYRPGLSTMVSAITKVDFPIHLHNRLRRLPRSFCITIRQDFLTTYRRARRRASGPMIRYSFCHYLRVFRIFAFDSRLPIHFHSTLRLSHLSRNSRSSNKVTRMVSPIRSRDCKDAPSLRAFQDVYRLPRQARLLTLLIRQIFVHAPIANG